jgi:hypothetical protein
MSETTRSRRRMPKGWLEILEALYADSWNPQLGRFRSRFEYQGSGISVGRVMRQAEYLEVAPERVYAMAHHGNSPFSQMECHVEDGKTRGARLDVFPFQPGSGLVEFASCKCQFVLDIVVCYNASQSF